MTEPLVPAAGRFAGRTFVLPVRVYYEDTDAAGIVYYANYLRFAERARSELLRGLGTDNVTLMRTAGVAFAVRRCVIDYLKPAQLDDDLEVATGVRAVHGASFLIRQRIRRDAVDLVGLEVRMACVTLAGRPARTPPDLRASLEALVDGEPEVRCVTVPE